MDYYAHKNDKGEYQEVKLHLKNTAELARDNSVGLMKQLAYAAGYAHDLGKYSAAFQSRLEGGKIKFEHSSCGAIEYRKSNYNPLLKLMLEYCIAGHHTGLPDGGSPDDTPDNDITLYARLKRDKNYTGNADYSAYKNETELVFPECAELLSELQKASKQGKKEFIEEYAFFIRYLFSCLTDADFLDTERFCNPEASRLLKFDIQSVIASVERKFGGFVCGTALQKARGELQEQAFRNAEKAADISILNMPTGSGKTLCSLKIALNKLLADKSKKRIIYVIPYTSIIEQTAGIFKGIFGEYADILEHHSNYSYDDCDEPDTAGKLKKAAENWDAPVIITTSVQFFESLYHYKGSSLRKLHNTADSVIIFDEIHLLPAEMLQPCLRGIGYITKYLNSEAIFLSATMPDYGGLFRRYIPECSVTELLSDKSGFTRFKKCGYTDLGRTDMNALLEKADGYKSSLIVVNKRKTAREFYNNITGNKYHLSTYMTPHDRSETIDAIRKDLANGEKITVVSTSLIEAGVDLDFKAVFREIAGLDNILQSGGRCNREGRDELGDVYIFETDDGINKDLRVPADIVKALFKEYDDISSNECIEEYYSRLYENMDEIISENSVCNKKFMSVVSPDSIPFRTYAENFRFIRESSVGVVIDNCAETKELCGRLKLKDYSVKRSLQKYTVSLRLNEFSDAVNAGVIDDFGTGVFILKNKDYYKPETGLDLDYCGDYIG